MTRVCLAGATGWVGRGLVPAIVAAPDLELAAAVARRGAGKPLPEVLGTDAPSLRVFGAVADALDAASCDVLVDYTSPEAVRGHVLEAVRRGVHAVIGTSGLTEEDFAAIDSAAREKSVGVLAAGNFALTAVLLANSRRSPRSTCRRGRSSSTRAPASPTRRAGRRASSRRASRA